MLCTQSAALIFELCAPGRPFVEIAFELKERFPEAAGHMVRDCAEAVAQLLELRLLYRVPVMLP